MKNGLGLVGHITIKRYKNNNFDSPVEVITTKNLVTSLSVKSILKGEAPFNSSIKIALSTLNESETYNRETLTDIIAIGSVFEGVSGYNYVEKTDTAPRYVEYIGRFNFVGYTRSFRTIGLVTGTPGDELNNLSQPCYAYKSLPYSVGQQENETIDIYYRVSFDWSLSSGKLLQAYREAIELASLGRLNGIGVDSFIGYGNVLRSPVRIPLNTGHNDLWGDYETIAFTSLNANKGTPIINNNTFAPYRYSSARYEDVNLLKHKYEAKAVRKDEVPGIPPANSSSNSYFTDPNTERISFLSKIFASALYGSSGKGIGQRNKAFYFGDITNTREPFQNVFSHSSDAQTLFYDNQKLSNSSWKPIIEGSWNKKLPKLITLEVKEAGGLGVGSYQFKICPYTEVHKGFSSSSLQLPWKGGAELNQFHYYRAKSLNYDREERRQQLFSHDCIVIPIDQERVITANETGITIFNLATGDFKNYDEFSTPGLDCQNITQIGFNSKWNSNIVYVADRLIGLIKVNISSQTVEAISNESCFGVDVKDDGTVVALLDRKVKVSTNDFDTSVDYTIPSISIENWDRINFCKVEKDVYTNHKVLLCAKAPFGSTTGYYTKDVIYWWNSVNGLISTRETPTTLISSSVFGLTEFIRGGHACSRPNNIEWNRTKQVWVYKHSRNRSSNSSSWRNEDIYAIASSDLTTVNEVTSVTFNDTTFTHELGVESLQRSGFNFSTILLNEKDEIIIPHGVYEINATKDGFLPVHTRNPIGTTIVNTTDFFDYVLPGSLNSDVCYLGQGLVLADWKLTYMYRYSYNPSYEIGVVKSWNSTTNSFGESPSNTAKPLHTNTISLDEGLTIRWQDLNPGNSKDLIPLQFYTQVISLGVVCDGYEGNIPFNFFYSLRPTVELEINTVLGTNGIYYLPASPTGSVPDPLFYSIEDTEMYSHKLKIDGIDVAEVIPPGGSSPASGQIKILDPVTGVITYSGADSGKTLTGTVLYYRKMHPTEI